jgi:DNA-binding response OmpR family regulator
MQNPPLQEQAPVSAAPGWAGWSASGRILVVDDDEPIRTVLFRALSRLGFDVSVAADGSEALGLFRKDPASLVLVLLDLKLPGLSSRAVFQEMRASRSELPIVLMSGYPTEEAMEKTQGQDFAAFIHKPFTLEVLAATVRAVLAA